MLGTAVSLGITLGLAEAFTDLAHLTGLSSEESSLLIIGRTDIDLPWERLDKVDDLKASV